MITQDYGYLYCSIIYYYYCISVVLYIVLSLLSATNQIASFMVKLKACESVCSYFVYLILLHHPCLDMTYMFQLV